MTEPATAHAAIVTGAADGIGWATAQRLAADGHRVALLDLRADAAIARAAELGPSHLGLGCDVTLSSDVDLAVAEVARRLGRIGVLVNNAGVGDQTGPTVDQQVAAFDRVLAVHLRGSFLMSQAVARHMLQGPPVDGIGRGAIVNLGSIASLGGLPSRNAYSAAKAGIGMMTRTLGCEWAAQGIRVNAIAPGYMLTPFMQKLVDEGKLDADQVRRRTPAGRLGSAQHIADAMLFLASDGAEFITGVTLPVDGGYMAWGAVGDAYSGPLN